MNFFKTKKTKRIEKLEKSLKSALSKISSLEEEFTSIKERLDGAEENMDDYKRYREEKEMLKNSGEPWVDFETRVVDNDGRVEVKMDWNSEFIDYLKKEGFSASSDEELVSIYFSSLVREAGDELSEEQAKKYMDT
jgi:septal ring factor EnvC (AmiA/AmiB activator)